MDGTPPPGVETELTHAERFVTARSACPAFDAVLRSLHRDWLARQQPPGVPVGDADVDSRSAFCHRCENEGRLLLLADVCMPCAIELRDPPFDILCGPCQDAARAAAPPCAPCMAQIDTALAAARSCGPR